MTQINANATAVDIFNKIKVVKLDRCDPILFYVRKKKFLSNLRKNVKQFKYKYNDTIFLKVNFPSINCHHSELLEIISDLNQVWSSFILDPYIVENLGFFKYVNIKQNNIDDIDVNIYTILHVPMKFLDGMIIEDIVVDVEDSILSTWEYYRYTFTDAFDSDEYCYEIGTIESVNNIFTTYLESFVHFYDLNNHYLNKTLLSVGGTMSQMMK